MNIQHLEVFGDSALIIYQVSGGWQTKDPKLIPYHDYLENLYKKFQTISFDHLPRSKNQFADALATLASMVQISDKVKPLMIEVHDEPAHCMEIGEDEKPWYYDIKNYLQKNYQKTSCFILPHPCTNALPI